MPAVNSLDIIVLALCLALLARGIWVGFVRQLAFIAALVVGYAAAGRYYPILAPYTADLIANSQLNFFCAYLVMLLTVYLLIILLGLGLKKVMQVTFLGWFDRLLGGVFGLAKALFLSVLLFMVLSALLAETSPMLQQALTRPYLMEGTRVLLTAIDDHELRRKFLPRPPAIPKELLPAPGAPVVQPGQSGRGNT